MYVSMNPKGETGKVIHISQNDTNREVEFIPYDQKGLTPLTDGQLMARINSIKGNTISFNQLIQNGNFADTSNWNRSALASYSASNNIYSWTGNAQYNGIYQSLNWVSGHKYYFTIDVYGTNTSGRYRLQVNGSDKEVYGYYTNAWAKVNGIYNCALSRSGNFFICDLTASEWTEIKVRYAMVFDLTAMGIDNLTTTAQVEAWLSSHIGDLPYYDYTQGTLIPFMGTGLKTVGFNQWDEEWELGNIDSTTGQNTSSTSVIRSTNYIRVKPNTTYCFTCGKVNVNANVFLYGYDGSNSFNGRIIFGQQVDTSNNYLFTTGNNDCFVRFRLTSTYGTSYDNDICINISDASKNGTYEPYTSNTLSLSTLTYFPTGMKSNLNNVCDEISNNKALTKIGQIDIGSLDIIYNSSQVRFYCEIPSNFKVYGIRLTPLFSGLYKCLWHGEPVDTNLDMVVYTTETRVYFQNHNFTTATDFKTAMSGVMLYYELATPTETSISPELDLTYPIWSGGTEQILPVNTSTPTTAPIKANITYPDRTEDTEFLYKQTIFDFIPRAWSFVCKNIESALTNVDGILKGTIPSTMTSESGKFPLKLKMTDNEGVCFSEKIDLFVERKP